MNSSGGVRRNVQKQKSIASCAIEVYIHEFVHALYALVLAFPPEPARTDGDVCFGRNPIPSVLISLHETLGGRRTITQKKSIGIKCTPGCLAGHAVFVPNPSAAGSYIAEKDSPWI